VWPKTPQAHVFLWAEEAWAQGQHAPHEKNLTLIFINGSDVYLKKFHWVAPHMMNKFLSIIISLSALLICCGKPVTDTAKPIIAVSIPPQKFFAQKIAGDLFEIMVMMPPGSSPHTYEPKPSQMALLSKAKLYLSIGVEFEKAWLERLSGSYPQLTITATDSGVTKLPMESGEESIDPGNTSHHLENEGQGAQGALDPHIWLSPELVKQQAATITRALCRLDPAHAALFNRNDSLFSLELSLLQDTIRQLCATRKQSGPFLVFHPSWGYFAHEFGLRQVSIEVQGKEPNPRELGAILTLARKSGIKTIYVQPQFSRRIAQIIAAQIGAQVVIADPLALDWETNLLQCARALEAR
jgi:zinc transport system substrate-binding protein